MLRTLVLIISIAMQNTGTLMLQCYRMRANGPHAPIKSSPLHQYDYERIRVLGHVPIAPQKFEITHQNFWCYDTDHILNSFHNNLILGLVEYITSLIQCWIYIQHQTYVPQYQVVEVLRTPVVSLSPLSDTRASPHISSPDWFPLL